MKKFILMFLFLSVFVLIFADSSDEWGWQFKESFERSKNDTILIEEKDWVINQWRNHSDEIFKTYKYYRKKFSEGIDITKEQEIDVVPNFYFDEKTTQKETDRGVDFYIYAFEHSQKWIYKLASYINLVKIAYHGNERAKRYIYKQKDNPNVQISLRLRFAVATLYWGNDRATVSYLMDVIKKAQDVETTDIKFSSPNESAILSAIRDTKVIWKRYEKGKDYNYILPLLRQMIFSRSKGIQYFAVESYYFYTNRAEMKRIYKECYEKIHNKNTPRKEFLDALYGYQALYFLQESYKGFPHLKKYEIGFRGIRGYFDSLAILEYHPEVNKNRFILVAIDKEKRLTDKEKIYFHKRLRNM